MAFLKGLNKNEGSRGRMPRAPVVCESFWVSERNPPAVKLLITNAALDSTSP